MNIWIVNHYAIPPSLGGLVRHYYYSKNLQKKGHSVRIFASSRIHNTDINLIGDSSLYKEQEMSGIEYTFVKSSNYSGNGLDRIYNFITFPFQIRKTLKEFYKREKPDVIYTSSPDLFVAFFSLLFGRKHKIPVLVEVRDLWPESIVEYNHISKKNPIIKLLYQLEKWIYKNADQLVFTFEGGKEYISDRGWGDIINPGKIHYINNGVDLDEYREDMEKYTLDDSDLEGDVFKVVYIGSIRRANNVQMLVDAAEEVKRRGENVRFLLYGDGTEKDFLEKKCQQLGLDNIIFKGHIEKKYIPYVLSKSNLNILNYIQASTWKYGGSQNKQFEYLASGRPICSNVKMGYSIIEKCNCGTETNITSKEQYADIILSYKNMLPEKYREQCENACKTAEAYDYKILSEKIERILTSCIQKS